MTFYKVIFIYQILVRGFGACFEIEAGSGKKVVLKALFFIGSIIQKNFCGKPPKVEQWELFTTEFETIGFKFFFRVFMIAFVSNFSAQLPLDLFPSLIVRAVKLADIPFSKGKPLISSSVRLFLPQLSNIDSSLRPSFSSLIRFA